MHYRGVLFGREAFGHGGIDFAWDVYGKVVKGLGRRRAGGPFYRVRRLPGLAVAVPCRAAVIRNAPCRSARSGSAAGGLVRYSGVACNEFCSVCIRRLRLFQAAVNLIRTGFSKR